MFSDRDHQAILTINLIFHHLDLNEHNHVLDLLTPDIVWIRFGKRASGLSAVSASLEERSLTRRTFHVPTDFKTTSVSDDAVIVHFHMSFFGMERSATGRLWPHGRNIGEYEIALRRVDGRWLANVITPPAL